MGIIRCKLTYLSLALLFGTALALQAQSHITASFENQALSDVFNVFANEHGFLLAYDGATVENQFVNINFDNQDIVSALYQVLDQANLDYLTLSAQEILIRPKPPTAIPKSLPKQKITGYIYDKTTGEALAFATVACLQHPIGTVTNGTGYFSLEWIDTLSTTLTLEARYLGYTPQRIVYQKNRSNSINFELLAQNNEIGTIIITDKRPIIGLSSDDLAVVQQTDQMQAGLGGQVDVSRNLQLLPGVAAFDDRSSEIKVRGSQSDENLMVWDGMLLYHVDHFFGTFGAINAGFAEEVKFYKNTFPINYGGRTAAVVDIKSPTKITSPATQITLGTLMAEGLTRITISPAMQLHLGGRTTINNIANRDLFQVLNQEVNLPSSNTIGQLLRNEQIRVQPDFRFYDFNAKWIWKASSKASFDLNIFRSKDEYFFDYGLEFDVRRMGTSFQNSASFKEEANWQNDALSFRWHQQWNENLSSRLTLGASSFDLNEQTNTELNRTNAEGNPLNFSAKNNRFNHIESLHLNWRNKLIISSKQSLVFGLRANQEETNLNIDNDSLLLLNGQTTAQQIAVYGAYTWNSEKWHFTGGLHSTYYNGTQSLYFSPRIHASFQQDDHWLFKGALHINQQFLRSYYHENRYGRVAQIWSMADGIRWPIAQSYQAMMGSTFTAGNFSLDAEIYYKHTVGVLEHTAQISGFENGNNLPSGTTSFQLYEGLGKVIGLDLFLRQSWPSYSTFLSYTLSKSTRQFDDLFRGEPYAAQDDRPHQISWVNQYHNKNWTLNLNYVMATGRPFSDLSNASPQQPRNNRSAESLSRIPDYHRVDFSVQRDFKINALNSQVTLSVFNVLNAQNTLYSQQVFSLQSDNNLSLLLGNELELLDRTFSVSVSVAF